MTGAVGPSGHRDEVPPPERGVDEPGAADEQPLLEQPVRAFLARLSSREPGPAAGSAAAVAAAMGAALAGKTARLSARQLAEAGQDAAGRDPAVGAGGAGTGPGGTGGGGEPATDADTVAAAADALRERALTLATEDAAGVVAMLTSSADDSTDPSAVPRKIGEVADAVGKLAAHLAEQGNPRLHADALAVGHLATAARAMVDAVVRSNEGTRS